ncbi:MAG: NUDIX domain-containing protein [Candidatus Promineifilaceae bacterium]
MPPNKPPSPFKVQSSRIVWSSPWYSVRQDQIILPNGQPGVYNVVQHPGAVWVIPVTGDGHIVLLYHYRYTVDDWCWEIPAGQIKAGRTMEETAVEELAEEVGGTAAELNYFGNFYTANGICNEVAHIYIARGVTLGQPAHEPAEVIEIRRFPILEALRMAHANEISDGPTALALLLCESRLLALDPA